jgi:branched-chain amino acid transport system substrate-binding protein
LARDLVQQDNVFAVTGIATAFFSPQVFGLTGTPTYGYNVTGTWNGPKNLFAAYGSVIEYNYAQPEDAYAVNQLHAKSVAVVALGIAQSANACIAANAGFHRFGIKVGYENVNVGLGANMAPVVQQLKNSHVDAVLSCMDVNDNIAFTRALDQYGLGNINQIWLNGQDGDVLAADSQYMQHVYFLLEHVPFEAGVLYPSQYPGIATYLKNMNKYEHAFTYDEEAFEGWMSADLFVTGLRKAGRNPTQQSVVAADNSLTNYTAGGTTTPVDWPLSHTGSPPPYCAAFVKVVGKILKPVFAPGHSVFVCFSETASKPNPIHSPAGVPGG